MYVETSAKKEVKFCNSPRAIEAGLYDVYSGESSNHHAHIYLAGSDRFAWAISSRPLTKDDLREAATLVDAAAAAKGAAQS